MKKIMTAIALLLTVTLLCAGCGLAENLTDAQAKTENLSVGDCVQTLADGDREAFVKFLHPDVSADAIDYGYAAMSQYLAGCKVAEAEPMGFHVGSYTGKDGNTATITAKFLVTFEAGGSVLVDVIYEENKNGSGFTQFLCEMGIAK